MPDTRQSGASAQAEIPTPPLDRVRHEMERWLEVARTTGERAMESLGLGPTGRGAAPPIDVLEIDSEVVILVDLRLVDGDREGDRRVLRVRDHWVADFDVLPVGIGDVAEADGEFLSGELLDVFFGFGHGTNGVGVAGRRTDQTCGLRMTRRVRRPSL